MRTDTNENLLTISAFRRVFFAAKSRPPKRIVERWIELGTAEGIALRARKIDGVYYVTDADARAFLDASRVQTTTTTDVARMNANAALETLRRMGVKC